MIGEVKWWKTQQASWRIERVAGESGGRRWEVTGWRVGAEEHTIALGRWVVWKSAIEAIVAVEEKWEQERQELERAKVVKPVDFSGLEKWITQPVQLRLPVEVVEDEDDWASDAWERDSER